MKSHIIYKRQTIQKHRYTILAHTEQTCVNYSRTSAHGEPHSASSTVFANALFKGLLWELTQQGEKKVRRTQFTRNWGPFLHGTSHFCLSPCFPTPATAPQGCRLWRSARGERTSPSLAGSMAFDQRTIKRASYSGFLLYKRTVGLHNPGVAVSHITLSLFLWPVCLAADKAK